MTKVSMTPLIMVLFSIRNHQSLEYQFQPLWYQISASDSSSALVRENTVVILFTVLGLKWLDLDRMYGENCLFTNYCMSFVAVMAHRSLVISRLTALYLIQSFSYLQNCLLVVLLPLLFFKHSQKSNVSLSYELFYYKNIIIYTKQNYIFQRIHVHSNTLASNWKKKLLDTLSSWQMFISLYLFMKNICNTRWNYCYYF